MIRPLVLIVALIVIGTEVHAASFDCAKARRGYEALICANEELSKADDTLADVYHRAHGALSSIGSEKEVKKARQRLEKEEKEWLKTRLSRCPDVDCLRREYQLRLATLRSYVPVEPAVQPPPVQATVPLSDPSSQAPEAAAQINPQSPSNPQQPEAQGTPPVGSSEPLPEAPVATSTNQPPTASESPIPIPQQQKQANASNSASAVPEITSWFSTSSSSAMTIAIGCYLLWGTFWGCKIVYPRMMSWYNSTTWFIFGTGPMDILKRQIIFGLQVRFWSVVIGIVVGCLGGAFYMQFFRSRRTAEA